MSHFSINKMLKKRLKLLMVWYVKYNVFDTFLNFSLRVGLILRQCAARIYYACYNFVRIFGTVEKNYPTFDN